MNETIQLTIEEPINSEPIILTLINPELIDSAPPDLELLSAPIRRVRILNIVSPESSPIDKELINSMNNLIQENNNTIINIQHQNPISFYTYIVSIIYTIFYLFCK